MKISISQSVGIVIFDVVLNVAFTDVALAAGGIIGVVVVVFDVVVNGVDVVVNGVDVMEVSAVLFVVVVVVDE